MSAEAELPIETNPDNPLSGWSIKDAVLEMQAACSDANSFLAQMATNEATRVCWWAGKSGTGKKINTQTKEARPFNGAADHEVHLTQAVINRRNAMRVAAIARGSLSVTPQESSDSKRAALMRNVLRYYLSGPMRSEVFTQGVRAGSYADRYRCSLLYVGWKEERGVEPIKLTLEMVAQSMQQAVAVQMAKTADGLSLVEGIDWMAYVADPINQTAVVEMIVRMNAGLKARGKEGEKQAAKALAELIKGSAEAVAHGSYVKRSAPLWEALEPFVDVFFPAEALMEDGLESCRWIARVKWRSAQWIREQSTLHKWNPKWVTQVLDNCKGRSQMFSKKMSATSWALNGAGIGWGERKSNETQNHLYQIIELWDRSMTSDGLTGTYCTIMHADVQNMVAERKLREDWDGQYPFVPFKFSMDEKLMLGGSAVPEITMTKEQAVKAQWDSRTDAAAMTTFPTWTGDPELEGMRPAPGVFIPTIRGQVPTAFPIPPPDGRSIEIERTIRASVNEFFGFQCDTVSDAVAMSMGQAEMDWFMSSFSQAIARTAKLIQQYMPPLKGARITGTDELITATADEVRSSFDFQATFNVKSTDVDWAKEHLGFIKEMVTTFDNRGDVNTLPILEAGFNFVDPVLGAQCLPQSRESAQGKTKADASAALSDIFTGGAPQVTNGMDYGGIAQAITDEINRSPLRQQSIIGGSQIHGVLSSYLSGLVNNNTQHGGENAQIGRTLAPDPLKQDSPAEGLLQMLDTLPDGVSLWQVMMMQQERQRGPLPGPLTQESQAVS